MKRTRLGRDGTCLVADNGERNHREIAGVIGLVRRWVEAAWNVDAVNHRGGRVRKKKIWLPGMDSNHDSKKIFGICKLQTIKTRTSHESHPFQPVMYKVCTREKSGMDSRIESMPGASSPRSMSPANCPRLPPESSSSLALAV
jgi:hypothetical protein